MRNLETRCPKCKNLINGIIQARGSNLTCNPGDFSICIYCGQILKFDNDLKLDCASEADLKELLLEDFVTFTELMKAQKAVNDCR